jgi:glutamate formiminotransferase/formiminotetrahydrofolate cyclodeaminase
MVANLTSAKSAQAAQAHVAMADRCQALKEELALAVDQDTAAFNEYLVAVRMPQDTDAERQARGAALQAGLRAAIQVPLRTARLSLDVLQLARDIVRSGLKASVTDAGVGAEMAHAGVVGGCLNVLTNLRQVEDEAFKGEMEAEVELLRVRAAAAQQEARTIVSNRIAGRKRQDASA